MSKIMSIGGNSSLQIIEIQQFAQKVSFLSKSVGHASLIIPNSHQGQIIVGTKDSEIFSIVERTSEAKQILSGHAEGDLCGLVTLPKVEQFLTASDDGTVKLWDASAKVTIPNTLVMLL